MTGRYVEEPRGMSYPVALMRAALVWTAVVPGGMLVLVRGFGQHGGDDASGTSGSTFGLFALLGCLGVGLALVAGARALVSADLAGPAAALSAVALTVVVTSAVVVAAGLASGVLGSAQAVALGGGSVIGWVAAVGYVLTVGSAVSEGSRLGHDYGSGTARATGWHIR